MSILLRILVTFLVTGMFWVQAQTLNSIGGAGYFYMGDISYNGIYTNYGLGYSFNRKFSVSIEYFRGNPNIDVYQEKVYLGPYPGYSYYEYRVVKKYASLLLFSFQIFPEKFNKPESRFQWYEVNSLGQISYSIKDDGIVKKENSEVILNAGIGFLYRLKKGKDFFLGTEFNLPFPGIGIQEPTLLIGMKMLYRFNIEVSSTSGKSNAKQTQ